MPRSFRIRCMVRIRAREMLQRRPASLPSARARSRPCFVRRLMFSRSMAATPAVTRATKLKPRWDVHLSGDDDQLGYAGESISSVLGQ